MAHPTDDLGELLCNPLVDALLAVFDSQTDRYFFVKDAESRFVYVNRALLSRLGLSSPEGIVGTTDRERYPPPVAEELIAGDRRVMERGEPLVDHAEVLFDYEGKLEWFSTSKYPILSSSGVPLGVAGVTRSHRKRYREGHHDSAAARAIDWISDHPASPVTISHLAKRFGISERQLHRQFVDLVGMSPSEFLLRSRIHAAAADLRRTGESIAALAVRYGFCDQSAFTRQFRRILGSPPGRYREHFATRP